MLVKKFETDCSIRLNHPETGEITPYYGSYFNVERFGEMIATTYGISVKDKVIPYAHIISFEPVVFTETIKTKRSKKSVGELESESVSLPEATESD